MLSNWLVADSRHDFLLGMPWRVSNNSVANYQKRFTMLRNGIIMVPCKKKKLITEEMSMSVNESRRIVSKNRNDPEVNIFQVVLSFNFSNEKDRSKKIILNCSHEGLRSAIKRSEGVIQSEFPSGLPPEREIDHEFEADKNSKPPYRYFYNFYQLTQSYEKES